jgi:hypothetical protein
MAKSNVRRKDHGPGADFINQQRNVDEAINQNKKESADDKLDPNRQGDAEYRADVDVKKAGRSKQ